MVTHLSRPAGLRNAGSFKGIDGLNGIMPDKTTCLSQIIREYLLVCKPNGSMGRVVARKMLDKSQLAIANNTRHGRLPTAFWHWQSLVVSWSNHTAFPVGYSPPRRPPFQLEDLLQIRPGYITFHFATNRYASFLKPYRVLIGCQCATTLGNSFGLSFQIKIPESMPQKLPLCLFRGWT